MYCSPLWLHPSHNANLWTWINLEINTWVVLVLDYPPITAVGYSRLQAVMQIFQISTSTKIFIQESVIIWKAITGWISNFLPKQKQNPTRQLFTQVNSSPLKFLTTVNTHFLPPRCSPFVVFSSFQQMLFALKCYIQDFLFFSVIMWSFCLWTFWNFYLMDKL